MNVSEWNQKQRDEFVPPEPFKWTPPPRTPIGCACDCGGEIVMDHGTVWGMSPASLGVKCELCEKKGYIDEDVLGSSPKQLVFPAPKFPA